MQETWAMFCENQVLQTNTGQNKKLNQFSLRPILDQEYPGLKENSLHSLWGREEVL